MTHSTNAVVITNTPLPTAGWPSGFDDRAPADTVFRPAVSPDGETAIVQIVLIGDTIASADTVWSANFDDVDAAQDRFRWLDAHPDACTRLGRHARLFGPFNIGGEIEVGVEIDRVRAERERERRRQEDERLRAEAEIKAKKARIIGSWLEDRDGQYGINLRRGDTDKAFWIILFREKWERERFRDWFRNQRHRFTEWAEFLESHSAIELERLLLAEMLETERRVQAAKLDAGGRRPLRFWRGEQ
jgi:hypothetical protein